MAKKQIIGQLHNSSSKETKQVNSSPIPAEEASRAGLRTASKTDPRKIKLDDLALTEESSSPSAEQPSEAGQPVLAAQLNEAGSAGGGGIANVADAGNETDQNMVLALADGMEAGSGKASSNDTSSSGGMNGWWLVGGLAAVGIGGGIAASGGGGGGSTGPTSTTVSGTVTDGPVQGARLYYDTNANGVYDEGTDTAVLDANGQQVVTDESGNFSFTTSQNMATIRLVTRGGTDTVTGETVTLSFSAPAGYTQLNPITSAIAAYMEASIESNPTITAAQAEAAVEAALGLPNLDYSSVNLANPPTDIPAGDILAAQRAAAILATTAIVIAQSGADADADAFQYLAENMGSGGSTSALVIAVQNDPNVDQNAADQLAETVAAVEAATSLDAIGEALNETFFAEVTTSGTVSVGQTLTGQLGLGNTTGLEVAYQWQSSADSATWTDIAGATGTSYQLTSTESGDHIRLKVDYTDTAGVPQTVFSSDMGVVNSPPVLGDYTVSLAENSVNGAAVQTVAAIDGDGDTLSYAITAGNASGAFAIDSVSGAITVADSSKLDFETTSTFSLTVAASDGTVTDSGTVTVNLTNVNDNAPTIGSGGTGSVAENSPLSTVIYDAAATDADAGTTITYSLKAATGDVALLNIDPSTGQVTLKNSADYEAKTSYIFTVIASDGTNTNEQAVTVTVTAANDNSPVFTSATSASVAENSTAVLTVAATDADLPTQTVTYSITGGADASKFTLNTITGALAFASAPDFENPTDADTNNSYVVQVTANDGNGGTSTLAITATVTGVNESAPVFTSATSTSVAENSTAVLTVAATDADLPAQTVTYSITGGADASKFTLNASTGALAFASAPDFENPTDADANNSYVVQVTANDGNGRTTTQTVTATVTDIDDTPPVATSITGTNLSSPAGFSEGDVVTLTFSEPVQIASIAVGNLAIDNGHDLGAGPIITPENPADGYATTFFVALGSGATITAGDTITLSSATVVDAAGNPAASDVVFTVPPIADGNMIRGTTGADSLAGSAGDDIFVLVGKTAVGQYSAADAVFGNVSLADRIVQANNVSEANPGDSFGGAGGYDVLHVYGNVDLTGVDIAGISRVYLHSDVEFSAEQMNALISAEATIVGDGGSTLRIAAGTASTVDLSTLSLSNIGQLDVGDNVTAVMSQANLDAVQTVSSGFTNATIKAVDATPLNFTGHSVFGGAAVSASDGTPVDVLEDVGSVDVGTVIDTANGVIAGVNTLLDAGAAAAATAGLNDFADQLLAFRQETVVETEYALMCDDLSGGSAVLLGRDDVQNFMSGGAGSDVIQGGAATNFIYGGFEGFPDGTVANTIYGGASRDFIQGGDDRDFIYGQGGDDFLSGGTGNDTIRGGVGTDFISSGDGADEIVFEADPAENGIDFLESFDPGQDTLNFAESFNTGMFTGQNMSSVFTNTTDNLGILSNEGIIVLTNPALGDGATLAAALAPFMDAVEMGNRIIVWSIDGSTSVGVGLLHNTASPGDFAIETMSIIGGFNLTDNTVANFLNNLSTGNFNFSAVTPPAFIDVVVDSTGTFLDANGNGIVDAGEARTTMGEVNAALNHVTIHYNDVPSNALDLSGFGSDDQIEIDVQAFIDNGHQALQILAEQHLYTIDDLYDAVPGGNGTISLSSTRYNYISASQYTISAQKDLLFSTGSGQGWVGAGFSIRSGSRLFYYNFNGIGTSRSYSLGYNVTDPQLHEMIDFVNLPATPDQVHVVVDQNGAVIDIDGDGVRDYDESWLADFSAGGNADLVGRSVTIHFNDIPANALDLSGFGTDDLIQIDVQALYANGKQGVGVFGHSYAQPLDQFTAYAETNFTAVDLLQGFVQNGSAETYYLNNYQTPRSRFSFWHSQDSNSGVLALFTSVDNVTAAATLAMFSALPAGGWGDGSRLQGMVDFVNLPETIQVVVDGRGAFIDANANGIIDGDDLANPADFESGGNVVMGYDHVTIHFNDAPNSDLNLAGFGADDLIEIDVQSFMFNGHSALQILNRPDIVTLDEFTGYGPVSGTQTFNSLAANLYRNTHRQHTGYNSTGAPTYLSVSQQLYVNGSQRLYFQTNNGRASGTLQLGTQLPVGMTLQQMVDYVNLPAVSDSVSVVVDRDGAVIDYDGDGVRDTGENWLADFEIGGNADLQGAAPVVIHFNDLPQYALDLTGFGTDDKIEFDVGSLQGTNVNVLNPTAAAAGLGEFAFEGLGLVGYYFSRTTGTSPSTTTYFTWIRVNHSAALRTDFNGSSHSGYGLTFNQINTSINGRTQGLIAYWTDTSNALNGIPNLLPDYISTPTNNNGEVLANLNANHYPGLVEFVWPVNVVVENDGAWIDANANGIHDLDETDPAVFAPGGSVDLATDNVSIHFNAIPDAPIDLSGFDGNDRIEIDLNSIRQGIVQSRALQSSYSLSSWTDDKNLTGASISSGINYSWSAAFLDNGNLKFGHTSSGFYSANAPNEGTIATNATALAGHYSQQVEFVMGPPPII